MTYKLAIFDMGNTLLDFHAGKHSDEEKDLIGCHNMQNYLQKNHQINISSQRIKTDLIDVWYSDFYKREQLIELNVCIYIDQFLKKIGYETIDIDYKALMENFFKPYIDEIVLKEGAMETLRELHDQMTIGIISNCTLFDDLFKSAFDSVGLSKYIDHYIFSYSRQIRKPDVRLFNEMIDYFGCKVEEVVMIGDNYKADIVPAQSLGIKTIHLTNNYNSLTSADISIQSLQEVVSSIKLL